MSNKQIQRKTLSLIVALAVASASTYLVFAFAQKLDKPLAYFVQHGKAYDRTLIALRLVGDDLLELGKPIVIRINNRPNGETIVTFGRRTASNTAPSIEHKPAEDIGHITFKDNETILAPRSFFERHENLNEKSSYLTKVAALAVSYALKRRNLSNFELEVNKLSHTYAVSIAPNPNIPNNNIVLGVHMRGGKLELIKIDDSP